MSHSPILPLLSLSLWLLPLHQLQPPTQTPKSSTAAHESERRHSTKSETDNVDERDDQMERISEEESGGWCDLVGVDHGDVFTQALYQGQYSRAVLVAHPQCPIVCTIICPTCCASVSTEVENIGGRV